MNHQKKAFIVYINEIDIQTYQSYRGTYLWNKNTSPCIFIFPFVDINDSEILNAIKASHEMKNKSYCPYSKFRVGAALLCEDGTIITGTFTLNL